MSNGINAADSRQIMRMLYQMAQPSVFTCWAPSISQVRFSVYLENVLRSKRRAVCAEESVVLLSKNV